MAERHGVAILDVLADLRAQAQLEATAAEFGQVPGRVGHQGGAAREGQRHAGPDGDALGVLGHQEGQRHGVVDRLGHVQSVVAERFDPAGMLDDLAQAEARVHAGVHLHPCVPSAPVALRASAGDDGDSRSVGQPAWSKRSPSTGVRRAIR